MKRDVVDAKPVFVDTTGRRRRRVWTVAYATSVAALVYVVAFGFVLAGGQISPHAGVGDRPRIVYPMPAPVPSATPEPTPVEEPMVMVGGAGWAGVPVSAEETVPASDSGPSASDGPPASDGPSTSDKPAPSNESSTSDEPTETGEPSDPADPTVPPVSPMSESETSAEGATVGPTLSSDDDTDIDV